MTLRSLTPDTCHGYVIVLSWFYHRFVIVLSFLCYLSYFICCSVIVLLSVSLPCDICYLVSVIFHMLLLCCIHHHSHCKPYAISAYFFLAYSSLLHQIPAFSSLFKLFQSLSILLPNSRFPLTSNLEWLCIWGVVWEKQWKSRRSCLEKICLWDTFGILLGYF